MINQSLDIPAEIPLPKFEVPELPRLHELRAEGFKHGYRGIHIYLRYREILRELHRYPIGKRVLNVGCGLGLFDRLLPRNLDFVGIDPSESEIAYAAQWARQERPNFKYIAGDLAGLRAPAHSFDLIIISEVIEHIPEKELSPMFARAEELLSLNGYLLLSVPNRLTLRNRARRSLGLPLVLMDQTHLREYTLQGAQDYVKSLPFEIQSFAAAVLYLPLERWLRWLISEDSRMRAWLVRNIPSMASHFIFVLAPRGKTIKPEINSPFS